MSCVESATMQKTRSGASGPSPATPRPARTPKNVASDTDSTTPPHAGSRLSMDRSPKPKTSEHKSPRSPLSEKRPTRASELQQQLAQAQEELKKAKEQVAIIETAKAQALQDLEEAKKLAEETGAKLEVSEKKVLEITENEKAQTLALQQASEEAAKERDREWQSKLEAVERQHEMDVAALLSTSQELERVNHELALSADSKAIVIAQVEAANLEIQDLRLEIDTLKMSEPNSLDMHTLLEMLRSELKEARASESKAAMIAREANLNLEEAKTKIERAKAEENKALESLRSVTAELEETNADLGKAKSYLGSLTETIQSLNAELERTRSELVEAKKREEEIISKEAERVEKNKREVENLELNLLQTTAEAGRAKLELETAYEEVQSARLETAQLRAALEATEGKFEAMLSEARLEAEHVKEAIEKYKLEAEEIMAQSAEREGKSMASLREAEAKANATKEELEKSKMEVADLKASLMDQENELQNIKEENENLKCRELTIVEKMEQMEKSLATAPNSDSSLSLEGNDSVNKKLHEAEACAQEKITEALAKVEAANAREEEAIEKLKAAILEMENSSQRANRSLEQLEAAQAANLAMEAEMKRLRIQTEQWKKAADAAATVLAAAHNGELNGKLVERSASLDTHLLSDSDVLNMKLTSPIMSDDMESSPTSKKKNAMLRKIGDLWKKRSQK